MEGDGGSVESARWSGDRRRSEVWRVRCSMVGGAGLRSEAGRVEVQGERLPLSGERVAVSILDPRTTTTRERQGTVLNDSNDAQ